MEPQRGWETPAEGGASRDAPAQLNERYTAVRGLSLDLCGPLETEDYCIQPMADASPPKWHLAHTSWFFETFILKEFAAGYQVFHPRFEYLFNSYYNGVGTPFPRPLRGNLSRPTVAEIVAYRDHVDEQMLSLLAVEPGNEEIVTRVVLGLHHEQQHQELLLTDIKHVLSVNPLRPTYAEATGGPAVTAGARR